MMRVGQSSSFLCDEWQINKIKYHLLIFISDMMRVRLSATSMISAFSFSYSVLCFYFSLNTVAYNLFSTSFV